MSYKFKTWRFWYLNLEKKDMLWRFNLLDSSRSLRGISTALIEESDFQSLMPPKLPYWY